MLQILAKPLPYFFIYTRFLCAPITIWLAHLGIEYSYIIGILLIYCCLNDIFDGVIARYLGTDTTFMRRLDSIADILYVISLYYAFAMYAPEAFTSIKPYLYLLVLTEGILNSISYLRFGKWQSAHNYMSKLFGFYSAIVFTIFFMTGTFNVFVEFSFVLGILARIDSILIYSILNEWTNDIPSSYHATLINKEIPFKRSKWFHSVTN